MTANVYLSDGRVLAVPTLLNWSVTHTDGEPCGCYSLEFLTDTLWGRDILQGATLQLGEDGVAYFTGVVDEVHFQVTAKGWTGTLYGRDLAARLLDNEARSTEYITAYLDDIIQNYVNPCGITAVRADTLLPINGFYVATGTSCWRVVEGFCRHSGDVCPRFLPDGTLALGYGRGAHHQITAGDAVLSLDWQYNLAEELSQIVEVDLVRKNVTNHENQAWQGDGSRQQVMLSTRRTTAASWKTAQQRIAESRREKVLLTVKLDGRRDILPLDTVTVTQPKWGIVGNFSVVEVTSDCQNCVETTTLVLRGN